MKLLILTCDRLESLKTVIEKAKEVFPITKIYIYVDKFYDSESNLKQKELLKFVKTVENSEVKVSKENKGCSASMKLALDWISETEDEFLVLEDDIEIKSEAFSYFEKLYIDRTNPFLIRFGESFWGWYANKLAIEAIKTFDLLNISDELYVEKFQEKRIFKHLNHFKMEKEAIRRRINTAWDREFSVTSLFLEIATFMPEKPLTKTIDVDSTRIRRNKVKGVEFESGKIVMINGVIQ